MCKVKTGGDPPNRPRGRPCEQRFFRRLGRLLGVLEMVKDKEQWDRPRLAEDLGGLFWILEGMQSAMAAYVVCPPAWQDIELLKDWAWTRSVSPARLARHMLIVRRAARLVLDAHHAASLRKYGECCRCFFCFYACQIRWLLGHVGRQLVRTQRKAVGLS